MSSDVLLCDAGCVNVGGVAGLEVQMTSSSPVSLLYRTVGWKGISVLYNLHSGS